MTDLSPSKISSMSLTVLPTIPTGDGDAADTSNDDTDDDNGLNKLRGWMSCETYQSLIVTNSLSSSSNHHKKSSPTTENDDDDDDETSAMMAQLAMFRKDNDEDQEEEEEATNQHRLMIVHEWTSSSTNVDGYGGYYNDDDDNNNGDDNNDDDGCSHNDIVKVKYILSGASGGHGDDLWASSRYLSNQFANVKQCRDLLKPLLYNNERQQHHGRHPLDGLSVIELGAGGGLPSLTAFKCGAKFVVCTDQAIPDRLMCLAEAAHQNSLGEQQQSQKRMFRVAPYQWGDDPHTTLKDELQLLRSLRSDHQLGNENEDDKYVPEANKQITNGTTQLFDVVVASDCLYNPQYHDVLLESIQMLLAPHGVALLPFALHGNTPDSNVWSIVSNALANNFHVQKVSSQQLTPQSYNMDSKRALVHTLRLTRIRM